MLIMIIMIAVDMMMWFSALGSFAHQRPFIRGDRLAQFLGMSEKCCAASFTYFLVGMWCE